MAGASNDNVFSVSSASAQVTAGSNKLEEFTTSYNGEVCHLGEQWGIIKFYLHGSKCHVFFIFSNVYNTKDNTTPVKPDTILMKQQYNFHILPVTIPTINNIRCFHAGLVWKRSKPRVTLDISFDPDKAISLLRSYSRILTGKKIPPPVEPKQVISGQSGMVWKAINENEGLIWIRKDKGGKIIWFNKSNLEKVERKFKNLKELVGVIFHFDAELLHAPADPNDCLWYQGTAFWDEGRVKPLVPNGFVGVKILNYNPTSNFSLKLKQGVELKSTNQFSPDRLDRIFKELTQTKVFKDVPASPAPQKINNNDNMKRIDEDLKNLKLGNERRTSLPGLVLKEEDRSRKSCASLPNETVPKTGMTPPNLNYNWRGNDLFYFNFPREIPKPGTSDKRSESSEIQKGLSKIQNERFQIQNGHFLHLTKTETVPDYFLASLNFKTIFNHRSQYKPGEVRTSVLPVELAEEDFVEKIENDAKSEYLSSLTDVFFVNVFTDAAATDTVKYLSKEPGLINHLSEDLKTGLIHCKYGCVYFKWEDFYDYDASGKKWKVGAEIGLSRALCPVFFDARLEEFGACKYVATCVWTEKRPDIETLIESVADVPKKLKSKEYDSLVVKLDLPSNAIVKVTDNNVGVVVTRGIFDPKRIGNISDYLSIGEKVQISVEGNNYYAESAVRHIRLPFDVTDSVEGYGVITNYSNRLGIFQYRTNNLLLPGIFNKDLARSPSSTYIPIGSFIRITGYLVTSHKLIRIVATTVRHSPFLKDNPSLSSSDPDDKPEFVPNKIYVGVVKSIRKPYACVLEAVNEKDEKVNVFVQSIRFSPAKWKPRLTYADQIQFHVKEEDKVMFNAEVCSDTSGLHPFKWHAAKAWKVESEGLGLKNSSDGAVMIYPGVGSGPKPGFVLSSAGSNVLQSANKEVPKSAFAFFQPVNNVQGIKTENYSRSGFSFPAPVPTSKGQQVEKDESFEEAMLKTALKNSLRDETVLPESLMNKIVENFSKRLTKDILVGVKKNRTKAQTKDKATQTLSTGKVIYLKIYPS